MFTGIITDRGEVVLREQRGDTYFRIRTRYDVGAITIGASIACAGVCLTVVDTGADWFGAETSAETLRCTTLNNWQEGTCINLERSLQVGDELGGHIVSGHVDGIATLGAIDKEGDSYCLTLIPPAELVRYIAAKGSITLDGVSLTVNEVAATHFTVNIIPHTWQVTTLGVLKEGDTLNLEVDRLARYVERMMEVQHG